MVINDTVVVVVVRTADSNGLVIRMAMKMIMMMKMEHKHWQENISLCFFPTRCQCCSVKSTCWLSVYLL